MNVTFQAPWAFALLLLVPLVIWLQFRKRRGGFKYSSTAAIGGIPGSHRSKLMWLPPLLRIAALVCLVVAIARPQLGLDPVRNITEGVAIAMALDRSGSMSNRIEFRGERQTKLDVVKTVFTEFVVGNDRELGGRPNDLIGVVAFAGYADTVSPLTHSHDALVRLLDELDFVGGRGRNGTAIGDAIALAAARLENAESNFNEDGEQGSDFQINSKIMILLTDGEHNAGERTPGEAAALAQRWGIKIYTIGFGGSAEGAALLENIAAETGGIYRRASDDDSLRAVYREIDRLETTEIESTQYMTLREYFPPFAIAALALVILDLLLSHTLFRRLP